MDVDDLIPERERGSEYLMLRLRTVHGIEEWEYRRNYFMDFDPLSTSWQSLNSMAGPKRQGDAGI